MKIKVRKFGTRKWRKLERASERERERETKTVIIKVFEAVFAWLQGAKTRQFDDHRV